MGALANTEAKVVSAFTLVELSIVIVIIGLIVAGITAGSSLIKQQKLNSILVDTTKYGLALNAFKLQYDAPAGDLGTANSFWSGCGTGATAAQCNGNGNGIVEWTGTFGNDDESARLWQHLYLAGYVSVAYTGVGSPLAGINAPEARFSKKVAISHMNGAVIGFPGRSHGFYVGKENTGFENGIVTFTPAEAYYLDSKQDDGYPATGSIHGDSGTGGSTCRSGSNYNIASSVITCITQIQTTY